MKYKKEQCSDIGSGNEVTQLTKESKDNYNIYNYNDKTDDIEFDIEKFYEQRQSKIEDMILQKKVSINNPISIKTNKKGNEIKRSQSVIDVGNETHRSNVKSYRDYKNAKDKRNTCVQLTTNMSSFRNNNKRLSNFTTHKKNSIKISDKVALFKEIVVCNSESNAKIDVIKEENDEYAKSILNELKTNLEKNLSSRKLSIETEDVVNKLFKIEKTVRKNSFITPEISITASKINPKLQNELIDIGNKRANLKSKEKDKDNIYNKNIEWKKRIVDRSVELKKKKEENELQQCSFSPKTGNEVKTFSNDFYEKNIKWKKKVDKSLQQDKIIKERKELEVCLFQPNNDKPTPKIKDNEAVYKKNIKWLEKVNDRRKQKDLEQQQEIIKMRSQSSRSKLNISNEYRSTKISSRLYTLPKQTIDTNKSMTIYKPNIDEIKHLFESLRDLLEENNNLMNDDIISNKNTINRVNSQSQLQEDKNKLKNDYDAKYIKLLEKYKNEKGNAIKA